MKKLRDLLDFLVSMAKAWPIKISVLLVIGAVITRFSKFASQSITFLLPI